MQAASLMATLCCACFHDAYFNFLLWWLEEEVVRWWKCQKMSLLCGCEEGHFWLRRHLHVKGCASLFLRFSSWYSSWRKRGTNLSVIFFVLIFSESTNLTRRSNDFSLTELEFPRLEGVSVISQWNEHWISLFPACCYIYITGRQNTTRLICFSLLLHGSKV